MSHLCPQTSLHSQSKRYLTALIALMMLSCATLGGCTPAFVKGTEIDYTPERQEVADFVERYRLALERRDFDTLKDMVSSTYYENGSTTNDPSDDYDFAGFLAIQERMRGTMKAVKYSIKITNIEVINKSAAVDYEFSGQYLFTHQERDRWETYADKNRLTLGKDKLGHWKILSGL